MLRLLFLLLPLAASAAPWQPVSVQPPPASHSLASVTCPGTGSTSSTITCTGTYTGTAPSTSGWTYAWNTCTGSGSVTSVASVSGGNITGIVFPTPASGCTGTVTLTDNLSDSATSGSVVISAAFSGVLDTYNTTSLFCISMRACTAAIAAAGTQPLMQLTRVADSHTCDILPALTGGFGVTASCSTGGDNGQTATTFAGTDTSGTGSISANTMTFTGGNIGDNVTGAGVSPGTVIVDGSSPAWVVNITQTVASTTLTLTKAIKITRMYDQLHAGTYAAAIGGGANPFLELAGDPNGNPAISTWFGGVINYQTMSITQSSVSQPFALSAVSSHFYTGTEQYLLSGFPSGSGLMSFNESGTANNNRLFCGADLNLSVTDSAWEAIVAVCNGGSSSYAVNSITPATGNAGSSALGNIIGMFGNSSSGGQPSRARSMEFVGWGSAPNSTQAAAIIANQRAFFGF